MLSAMENLIDPNQPHQYKEILVLLLLHIMENVYIYKFKCCHVSTQLALAGTLKKRPSSSLERKKMHDGNVVN